MQHNYVQKIISELIDGTKMLFALFLLIRFLLFGSGTLRSRSFGSGTLRSRSFWSWSFGSGSF